uniref:DUF4139 domain-containing protein n=1 Tax=Ditylenchus dipsaci TaxID=166011 RepID=A0A915DQ28_9BILA
MLSCSNGDKTKFQLIYYYGNIQQTSGEDWNDVELLLSTASPRSECCSSKVYLPLKASVGKSIHVRDTAHREPMCGASMGKIHLL